MALQLDYELSSGVVGDYWRITTYTGGGSKETYSRIVVSLYVSQEASDNGKAPIHRVECAMGGESYPFKTSELNKSNNNPLSIGYNKLKTLTEPIDFTKAESV